MKIPKVFISYSHDSKEISDITLKLSNKLRNNGIDADIDQYEECPIEGWPLWMENQITNSDFVLIICTKGYFSKLKNITDQNGKGVFWEVSVIYQLLYDNKINIKFIPIICDNKDEEYIPLPLKKYTFYNINTDFNKIKNRLLGIKNIDKPDLEIIKPVQHKNRRTLFYTKPIINVEKWNKAKWQGIAYFKSETPLLGLVFKEKEFGEELFRDLIMNFSKEDLSLRIDFSFIFPPFPKGSYIYNDSRFNNGNGYFIYIGPNPIFEFNELDKKGVDSDEIYIKTISRYRWQDSNTSKGVISNFENNVKKYGFVDLTPVSLNIMENGPSEFKEIIRISRIKFLKGINLNLNEPESIVLNRPN
jgi:hypothetical protein